MNLQIRPAQPSDRAAIVAMTSRLEDFGLPANVVPGEIAAGEARMLEQVFDQMPSGSSLLVAERDGGAIAGFVYLESKVDYFSGRAHGHVGILTVARDSEGQGVGRALLTAADEWAIALGYDRLTLFVFEGNARARATYERTGYRPDLVRYRRDLTPARQLVTPRLALIPATVELANADLAGRDALSRALHAEVPDEWPPELFDSAAIEWSLGMLRDPAHRDWTYLYATTRGERRSLIGIVGYKGAPTVDGTVEIGYGILPEFQRQGYATEASRALIARAFSVQGVRRVIAETSPELTASIGVLAKLGFAFVGDGSEPGVVRYELPRERWDGGA